MKRDSASKLDKTTPVPLYYQLKNILINQIKTGTYPIGTSIPTEINLRDIYDISRSTVRQAVTEMVQEGWLERKGNKGTFVRRADENAGNIHSFEPFYQQITRLGKTPKTEIIELSIIEAGVELAEHIKIKANEKVIYMFRRRFADNTPMVIMQNYLPYNLCSFILSHDFKTESLYEVLSKKIGFGKAGTKTIVSAEKASREDSKLLDIKIGNPILHFNTITQTKDGAVINYAFARYRGDINKFEINLYPEK